MLPRCKTPGANNLGPAPDQVSANPGDLMELDPAAAADALRSRTIAGSAGGFAGISSHGKGLVNLDWQLGRHDVRGSAAGANVKSAADVEAASWRGYVNPDSGMAISKPANIRLLPFDKQSNRLAQRANAASVAGQQRGLETGDLDGGVYNPRPAAAVWSTVAAGRFGTAAKGTAIKSAAAAGTAEHPAALQQ